EKDPFHSLSLITATRLAPNAMLSSGKSRRPRAARVPQHREVVPRNKRAPHSDGGLSMTQIQRGPSARSQSRETCGLIAQVVEIRERQGIESRSTISASYKNKFVRVFDPRQRTQEQRINKAQHRRVRPDAQGEG